MKGKPVAQRWPERTLEERFMEKVSIDAETGCWVWQAALHDGYGWFNVDGSPRLAHRVAYELFVGPIPEGMTLDHACHTQDENCPGGECEHRRCVNPAHLEPVTLAENKARGRSLPAQNARKTHCSRGHAYDEANTHVTPDGYRQCRQCNRENKQAIRERTLDARPVRICEAPGCDRHIPRGSRLDRHTCSSACRQRRGHALAAARQQEEGVLTCAA